MPIPSTIEKEKELELLYTKKSSFRKKISSAVQLKERLYLAKEEKSDIEKELAELMESEVFKSINDFSKDLITLRLATQYSHILSDLYSIRELCRSYLERGDFTSAISSFEKFDEKLQSIREIKSRNQFYLIESSMGDFDQHLKETQTFAFNDINSNLKTRLLSCLKDMNWPKLHDNQEISNTFIETFLTMTKLKIPNSRARSILASFACLAHHHRIAFKFHFSGSRQTNNVEKPEYYLTFLLTTFKEHSPFLEQTLQHILDESDLNLIALHEFISACLELVFEKLESDRSKILGKPHIFRHTLQELLLFDNTLDELYLYRLHSAPSCAAFFLEDSVLVKQWLDMERSEFTFNLDEVVSSRSESHLVDAYTTESGTNEEALLEHRISKSADCLAIMFGDFKLRYKHLPKELRKTLFDHSFKEGFSKYSDTLKSVVYKAQTSFYPISDKNQTKTKDLINICFAINSMTYVHSLLWGWSCDPYFLLTENGDDSIFSSLIDLYQDVSEKSMVALVDELYQDIEPMLASYKRRDWTSELLHTDMVSSELLVVLSMLANSKMIMLHLSKRSFSTVLQNLANLIDSNLLENVLVRKRLSEESISQFKRDLDALGATFSSNSSLFHRCNSSFVTSDRSSSPCQSNL